VAGRQYPPQSLRIYSCLYITDPEDRTEQGFATSGGSGTVHILQRSTERQSALMCVFNDLGIASYSFIRTDSCLSL
jgi:hypothetical protein